MQSAPIAPETDETTPAAGIEAEPTSGALVPDAPMIDELLHDELLIEEISIDGMCGVY